MRSVVYRNVFMQRIPVEALCFEWEYKRLKTESTWKFFPLRIKAGGKVGWGVVVVVVVVVVVRDLNSW